MPRLVLRDKIYGQRELTAPVLIELIHSPSVQRLKHITQFGVPDEFNFKKSFSRYEHSVGVMILLKYLSASEEEQIAGLLHDASHTAFSHVYDWVVDEKLGFRGTEDTQDARHFEFLTSSEIPALLRRFGYQLERIASYHDFKLLERESPELCADRVDYAIREISQERPALARDIFENLVVREGGIICREHRVAREFAKAYLKLQQEHWASFQAVARYHYFAGLLRRALDIGLIGEEEFLGTEEPILGKIRGSDDPTIQQALAILSQKDPPPLGALGLRTVKKFRYIDPKFLDHGKTVRLSEADPDFCKELAKAREENSAGIAV